MASTQSFLPVGGVQGPKVVPGVLRKTGQVLGLSAQPLPPQHMIQPPVGGHPVPSRALPSQNLSHMTLGLVFWGRALTDGMIVGRKLPSKLDRGGIEEQMVKLPLLAPPRWTSSGKRPGTGWTGERGPLRYILGPTPH